MKRLLGVWLVVGAVGCGPDDPVAVLDTLGARIARNEQGEVDFVDLSGTLVYEERTGNILRTETRVTDGGLVYLKELTRLQELRLNHTPIGDAGLAHLGGLIELEVLQLADTQITDAGLKYLRGMSELQSLDLADTRVTQVGLAHLVGLTNLEDLDLRDTQITVATIADFEQALPNCKVRY